MAHYVKDDLAMRLTFFSNRWTRAAVASTWVLLAGCQRIPYIDQSKPVPHDQLGSIAQEDHEVQQATFFSQLDTQLPDFDPPRTPDNPDAYEIWPMTLEEAIEIALSNSEVVRVIALGAQGIPVTGFEPSPLQIGVGGVGTALGAGTLSTVYDPAIQETQIAAALSRFDANLTTRLFYQRQDVLVNNAIQAGFFGLDDPVFALARQRGSPAIGAPFPTFGSRLQKTFATGSVGFVQHNVNWFFSNFPTNTFPSVYGTELQFGFVQPLLGGATDQTTPSFTGIVPQLSGLEANRAPIVIARLNADVSVWRFKAEIMAMVRSVEQQYWSLAQQQVQYWSRQQAVKLGEAILERELIKKQVGTGAEPDVAEAEQQLRNFQLNLVQATTDLINTERQLRNLLGLKPADNRRIVPVTAPTEARLEPDWETSMAQMISYQPDIVQSQLLVRVAELQLLLARNQLLPALNLELAYQLTGLGQDLDTAYGVMTGQAIRAIDPIMAQQQSQAGLTPTPPFFRNFHNWQVGLTFNMPLGFRGPLAFTRQAQHSLLRQRAFMQQIVHQQTHALYRFFMEVDSNYKALKYAGLAREAAERRLAAQRAFFEAGTINIDRYLDAVNQWANAVAVEAQFKASYNVSIAALEEAKGTLLAYDNVAVAEGPQPRQAHIQAQDQRRFHFTLPTPADGPYNPKPIVGPPVADPVVPEPSPTGEPSRPSPVYPAPWGLDGPPAQPLTPSVPAGDAIPQASYSPESVTAPDESFLPASFGAGTPPSNTPRIRSTPNSNAVLSRGDDHGMMLDTPISLPPLPPER